MKIKFYLAFLLGSTHLAISCVSGKMAPEKYVAGFISITFKKSAIPGKEIPVSLWFPIKDTKDVEPIPNIDYVATISEGNLETNKDLFLRILHSFGNADSAHSIKSIEKFLNRESGAVIGDFPTGSQYPLVVIGGGNPFYHIALAQLLAKNGFVVASMPRLGKTRDQRLGFDPDGSKEYQSDINFLLQELEKYKFIDVRNLSLITWSFEGVPCFEFALENENIKHFISLDSSLGYDYGSSLIVDSVNFFAGVPAFDLAHFTGSQMDHGKSFKLMERLEENYQSLEVILLDSMQHSHFTSISSIMIPEIYNEVANKEYLGLIDDILSILKGK